MTVTRVSPCGGLDDPGDLLCRVLGLARAQILTCSPVQPPSRNRVWRCRVSGSPGEVYLKIQDDSLPSTTVADEAEVLAALQGRQDLVPELLGCSDDGGRPRALVLAAMPGKPLAECAYGRDEARHLFEELTGWVAAVAADGTLPALLAPKLERAVGVLAPGFDVDAALRSMFARVRHLFSAAEVDELGCQVAGLSGTAPQPVWVPIHGSLTTRNVLVDRAPEGRLRLSAILDFEATRLGAAAWDGALFLLSLREDGRHDVGDLWEESWSRRFPGPGEREWLRRFALFQRLSRDLAAAGVASSRSC